MALTDNYPIVQVPGAEGVYHIFCRSPGGGGDAWCHLVPGAERALLIDTGFGIGNLKEMVESLTDLPVDVVNTHNHGDHTGGNYQFDRAYIHKMDAAQLYTDMEGPQRAVPPDEERQYKYFDEELIQPCKYEVTEIEDGHIFDLGGGYKVEVFHLPGHASGGIGLLDYKRGMLFSGDALVWTPTLLTRPMDDAHYDEYGTVERFKDGLLRLNAHIDEVKSIYPGHSRLGLKNTLITDMIACCDELLSGDTSVHYYAPGTNAQIHVHGMAKIGFTESRIHVR